MTDTSIEPTQAPCTCRYIKSRKAWVALRGSPIMKIPNPFCLLHNPLTEEFINQARKSIIGNHNESRVSDPESATITVDTPTPRGSLP